MFAAIGIAVLSSCVRADRERALFWFWLASRVSGADRAVGGSDGTAAERDSAAGIPDAGWVGRVFLSGFAVSLGDESRVDPERADVC